MSSEPGTRTVVSTILKCVMIYTYRENMFRPICVRSGTHEHYDICGIISYNLSDIILYITLSSQHIVMFCN